jgi:hypothetical protein
MPTLTTENNLEKLIEFQEKIFDLDTKKFVEIPNKRYELALEASSDTAIRPESNNNETTIALSEEQIKHFSEFCRNVRGYKLDDFPPGSCKRGVRRESKVTVLGPFDLTGSTIFGNDNGNFYAYTQVEIKNGKYKSDSTKEGANLCVGRGEIHGNPEGSFNIIVRKGLKIKDIKEYNVQRGHDDDFGRHAEIAAGDMCRQIISFIYDELT